MGVTPPGLFYLISTWHLHPLPSNVQADIHEKSGNPIMELPLENSVLEWLNL